MLRDRVPDVDVWAYGSRVGGESHRWTTAKSSRERLARRTKQWREQQAEAQQLDAAIEENLRGLGFG